MSLRSSWAPTSSRGGIPDMTMDDHLRLTGLGGKRRRRRPTSAGRTRTRTRAHPHSASRLAVSHGPGGSPRRRYLKPDSPERQRRFGSTRPAGLHPGIEYDRDPFSGRVKFTFRGAVTTNRAVAERWQREHEVIERTKPAKRPPPPWALLSGHAVASTKRPFQTVGARSRRSHRPRQRTPNHEGRQPQSQLGFGHASHASVAHDNGGGIGLTAGGSAAASSRRRPAPSDGFRQAHAELSSALHHSSLQYTAASRSHRGELPPPPPPLSVGSESVYGSQTTTSRTKAGAGDSTSSFSPRSERHQVCGPGDGASLVCFCSVEVPLFPKLTTATPCCACWCCCCGLCAVLWRCGGCTVGVLGHNVEQRLQCCAGCPDGCACCRLYPVAE